MSEAFWIAVVGAGGVVSTALSGIVIAMLSRQHKSVKSVREQVENDHKLPGGAPYNLRDNIDANQTAVMSEIRGLRKDVGRLDNRDIARGEEIRELSRTLGQHLDWSHGWKSKQAEATHEIADRLEDIEDTLNPTKNKPKE
ncbi:hypothetical protein G7068_16115 [Leucobacter viscericola]|uniref:Uncharacterized protein n=1 Tax=Leucobacter viscericola TaxID=2714935 RepID=A0A6G7XB10_9MICO|nr:hypothetical protein [Leucobacter viscericola]QIK61790.1 hypothetical protein G7068_00125 [Leucobacter viscericola]QIK64572.1 hypothetical protein G7068_16115 [Leucobacter viscericola]